MQAYPSLVIIQIFIICLCLLPLIKLIRINQRKQIISLATSQSYKNCLILLSYTFCILASYDGDWYHYRVAVYENYYLTNPFTHIEPIHIWIIKHLSAGNYILWRIIVWGATYIFIKLSFKRLSADDVITWTAFILVCQLSVSTGRVYLGISILFYGFCCVMCPKIEYLSVIKGITLMGVSLFFHKSLFIYLIAALFALIYYRKWMIVSVLVLFPVIVKIFTSILIMFVMADNLDKAAMGYLSAETQTKGIGISLYNNIFTFIRISIFIIGCHMAIKGKYIINTQYTSMLKYVFNLWYIYAVIFLTLTFNDIGSQDISGRVLAGLGLPTSILFSSILKSQSYTKIGLYICIILICAIIYRLLYAYYLQRLGGGI